MLSHTIGWRALITAQRSIDIHGQNLANFATEGYSRQRPALAPSSQILLGNGSFGTGVTMVDLQRSHDALLERQIRGQLHLLTRSQTEGGLARSLEGFFAEPGETGLAARLGEVFEHFSRLTGSASDRSLRSGLLQGAEALSSGFNQIATELDQLTLDAQEQVRSGLNEVNTLLAELASVNREAMRTSRESTPPNLLDQQDRIARQLAGWLDVQFERRHDGTLDALVDGHLLASGDRQRTLEADFGLTGTTIKVTGQDTPVAIKGGRVGGALAVLEDTLPERRQLLDEIARSMILEVNRAHSTGIPSTGPYQALRAGLAVNSTTGLPDAMSRRLENLDLPFDVQTGTLTVNIEELATGNLTQHSIAIDPRRDSLETVTASLDQIPGLSARLDADGRLHLNAGAGRGFDFSARLDPNPDDAGSFGGAGATLSGQRAPYALQAGDSLTVAVDGGPAQTVTFNPGNYAQMGAATAEEVAADLNQQLTGITALAVDDRIVLKSDQNGPSSSLLITDGSGAPAAALGLSTTLETGQQQGVNVTLSGNPGSASPGRYLVRPTSDGVLGLTDGLRLEVLDEAQQVVAEVDVGPGYTPGDPIEILPGLNLSLSVGEVSASAGDFFEFEVIGDSDSTDLLVALELGNFFEGHDATTLQVGAAIRNDVDAIAGDLSGQSGDGLNFARLLEIQQANLEALNGRTLEERYSDLVTDVGLDVHRADIAEQTQSLLVQSLEARRDEISGVNIDEEMLRLVEMQQLMQASMRFLQIVSETEDMLLQL